SEAADLVTLLLVPQISQRITVVQALQSPFFPFEQRSLLQPEGDWLKWRANGHLPLPKELFEYAFGEGNSTDRGEDIQPNTISSIIGSIANWYEVEQHNQGQFWYFQLKPLLKYRTETPICLAIDENNPAFEMLKAAAETNSNQEFIMNEEMKQIINGHSDQNVNSVSFTEYLNNVSESVGKNVQFVATIISRNTYGEPENNFAYYITKFVRDSSNASTYKDI
ncbi:MAG: hypothetical protein EZS28_022052, partial [Streblomastix strix]